jgi:hypothetical protein
MIHRWWDDDPSEVFWMEITDRPDIGVDLKAPQRDDSGAEKWTYALVKEVQPGDVVLHWSTPKREVVGWSIADGEWFEEPIIWAAHGTVARNAGVVPYPRDGWRRAVTNYTDLRIPITRASLQPQRAQLLSARTALQSSHGEHLYFPFQIWPNEVRAAQGYMVKFPRDLLALWPEAVGEIPFAGPRTATTRDKVHPANALGTAYRPADELVSTAARNPFFIDPNLVDRGTRGHAKTQNALAAWVRDRGAQPLSPNGEPMFDLAWLLGDQWYVAEVKSLTTKNEERQLRLGLGQVLRYRQLLSDAPGSRNAVAVLMVEREPSDPSWSLLCDNVGVRLVWPAKLASLAQL